MSLPETALEERLRTSLEKVRERIARAAERSGRKPDEIILIGASKSIPAEVIECAVRHGLREIGENYAQEALVKYRIIGDKVRWHFIGSLQTNKAKVVVRICQFVQSLDRWSLAEELNRQAVRNQKIVNCLIQVNLGGEGTKSGVDREGLWELAEKVVALPSIRLVGLMTIPPYHPDPEKSRPVFSELRELRDRLQERIGMDLPYLSMGMSLDFEVAIEEGANMVRIGTALFGPRPSVPKKEDW